MVSKSIAKMYTNMHKPTDYRIATNDDSLVGSCVSASSRSKFNADWP